MDLHKGLYESLLNHELKHKLEHYEQIVEILSEELDKTQAPRIIAEYLSKVMNKGFLFFKDNKEGLEKQIKIANKLIEQFSREINDTQFHGYKIETHKLIRGIFNKNDKPINLEVISPISSISHSTLFTGSVSDPTLYSELKKEMLTADRIDLLVSFIKYSGLRLILENLKEHTQTKQLRVITTSYMGATDYKAIEELAKLPNTTVKISYDSNRTRLHAKAYYFHRETGFSTAYIGSSNVSKAALGEGTEWNMKVSEYTSPEIIEKFKFTFETYWNSEDFHTFNPYADQDVQTLKKSLQNEGDLNAAVPFLFDIHPYVYQQEILDKLEVERTVFKSKRNLVVAATGTGKTVISAFDFKRYTKENPCCKLLFLAHRKEILEQSVYTFRAILKDPNFGDLWVGTQTPTQTNHLFASIQTLSRSEKFHQFSPKHFDFIILDETHHGTADSYDNLLRYFQPDILVGLTATPERLDGKDITPYFNGRIAYEIRLHEAINKNLLCPFHYFGVTDSESLENVSFSRGKYDVGELNSLYTGNHVRAGMILEAVHRYVTDIHRAKGIGFCVSIEHANFMATYFNKKDVPSISLHAQSDPQERAVAKKKLENGELNFIFVVDLYNEGVDIPQVNTVLFLRPTESATIFIQQLGRGLRLHEEKDVLTVLDFVGQASRGYTFRSKLVSMIGRSHHTVETLVTHDFPTLPKGCHIHLERIARQYILENLKWSVANKRNLQRMIREFKFESTKECTLSNFLTHYKMEPYQIYKYCRFYDLLQKEGILQEESEKDLKEFQTTFKRVMQVDSMKMIDFFIRLFQQKESRAENLSKEERILLLMWTYTIWGDCGDGDLISNFQRLKTQHPLILREMLDLVGYNRTRVDLKEKRILLHPPSPLELYARYSTDQVLAAMGVHTEKKKVPFREGVYYVENRKTDLLFVTLHKSEKEFKSSTLYEDYALTDRLFHWQSQSRTSVVSPTGQRYIHQRKNGTRVLLFVREYKLENGITAPYYFLGKANYVSHSGSKPINIVWELEEKMPAKIYKQSNTEVG